MIRNTRHRLWIIFLLVLMLIAGIGGLYSLTMRRSHDTIKLSTDKTCENLGEIGIPLLQGDIVFRSVTGEEKWFLGTSHEMSAKKDYWKEEPSVLWYMASNDSGGWKMFEAAMSSATSDLPGQVLELLKEDSSRMIFLHGNFRYITYDVIVDPKRRIFVGFSR